MNNQRSKRIMGLSTIQLVVLLCLICSLCGVFGTGAYMLAGGMGLTFTTSSQGTSAPVITATFAPTWTPTPLPTSTPMPTPLPYESIVPVGWRQYKNENVEIWLPPTYAFIDDPVQYNKEVADALRKLGQEDLAKEREQNPPTYELLFRGPATNNLYIPGVFVKQFPRKGLSLAQFIDSSNASLGQSFSVVERKPFGFYGAQGERVVIQANFNSLYVGYVYYLVQDGELIWEIGCDAHLNDFYNFQPTFDQIAQTFRPVHP